MREIRQSELRNYLLRALPEADFAQLLPALSLVPLKFKQVLHEPGEPEDYVYFPESGVISMLILLENGWAVEMATIGNEGMLDIAQFLGVRTSESWSKVQVPGEAVRLSTADFRRSIAGTEAFRTVIGAYAMELFTLVAQSLACNRAHNLEQRAARWLLMTRDRVDADEFPITHAFLAEMLGAARPTVTVTLGGLQEAGHIQYHRSTVTILDRRGLEGVTCECYELIKRRFARVSRSEHRAGSRPNGHNGHAAITSERR
jgi:CRP-like cAMP-binding protein